MTIERKATPALLAGALLALGVTGCASWNQAHEKQASATSEHRSARRTISDAAITAKVKTAFATDKLVKAREINVDTSRGVVQLYGTVDSAAARDRAVQIARNTEGVVAVKDHLKTAG